jgi:hypothetical protein
MTKTKPQVKNAIICDYIRQENTGKFILIGVYGEALVIHTYPATFFISLYLEIENVSPGPLRVGLRILVGETEATKASLELDIIRPGAIQLPVPPAGIAVSGPSRLHFQLSIEDSPYEEFLARDVRLPTDEEFARSAFV